MRYTSRKKKGTTKSSTVKKKSIVPEDIVFEEEATMEGTTFQDFLAILYGPPKIGKTKAMACVPGAYFIATEVGYKFVKVRKSKVGNWATFKKFVMTMEKSPKKAKTVKMWVVDTADKLGKYCMAYTCNRKGIEHPSDEEWGKGWEAFRDEWTEWILRLCQIGPGVCFICHETDKEITSRSMKITKTVPSIPKTCYTVLNELVDLILWMDFSGKIKNLKERRSNRYKSLPLRCVRTKPGEGHDGGDRTGKLPSTITFRKESEFIEKLLGYFSEEVEEE